MLRAVFAVFSCLVGMTLRAPCFGAFDDTRLVVLMRGVLMMSRPPSVGRARGLC